MPAETAVFNWGTTMYAGAISASRKASATIKEGPGAGGVTGAVAVLGCVETMEVELYGAAGFFPEAGQTLEADGETWLIMESGDEERSEDFTKCKVSLKRWPGATIDPWTSAS